MLRMFAQLAHPLMHLGLLVQAVLLLFLASILTISLVHPVLFVQLFLQAGQHATTLLMQPVALQHISLMALTVLCAQMQMKMSPIVQAEKLQQAAFQDSSLITHNVNLVHCNGQTLLLVPAQLPLPVLLAIISMVMSVLLVLEFTVIG